MAEVDINNPNLDGDFKAFLQARKVKQQQQQQSPVTTFQKVPEYIKEDEQYAVKKGKDKTDKLREELFEAAKKDDLQLLTKIVLKLPDFNVDLSHPSLRDPETNTTVLHVALENSSSKVSTYLIDNADDEYLCASFDVTVRKVITKKTALHILATSGDVTLMGQLLGWIDDPKKKTQLLYQTTLMEVAGQRPRDFAAIHIAALEGNTEALDYLVKEGVDVNLTNKKEDTAALWAARGDNLHTMRRLIELKADVDHQNDKGSTPLYWAVRYGYTNMVRLLAEEGRANVNHRRKLGLVSPIVMASALGYAEIVSLLLSLGADVNTKITNDHTALHYAATNGLDEVVDVLLRYNANVDDADDTGMTPLHMAAKNGHLTTMWRLCSRGASITCRDIFGKTVWSYAIESDGLGVLDVLVGVYMQRRRMVSKTLVLPAEAAPLHEAARLGDQEKISYLISKGCNPSAGDVGGNTFLHVAARENKPAILEAFQDIDVINKPNNDGELPIHLATRNGHTEAIKVLVKKTKLNVTNNLGYTPLHEASFARQVPAETVAVLVKSMVDNNNWSLIDATDKRGNTALHLAAMSNHSEVIPELKLLNPSILNDDGDNPFHAAAKKGNSDVLDVMFDIFNTPGKGLDLEQENSEGETVLHICTKSGSIELVEELIEAGADLAKRNKQGNTVLHEMAEEISLSPGNVDRLLMVYQEVVECAPIWWCIKHDLARPDPSSDTFVEYRRRSLMYLTSDVYNYEGFNVLGYCIKLGALPLFKAILSTEDAYVLTKVKTFIYDITNITPNSCVIPRKRKISALPGRAASTANGAEQTSSELTQSYLDIIADMADEVLATKFLDVVPVKQLSDDLWGAYQWIYITLMIVHILFMSFLSSTAISAAGVPFNTTTAEVAYTDPPANFPYVLFLSWPLILCIFQVFVFVLQIKHYRRRQHRARNAVTDLSRQSEARRPRSHIVIRLPLIVLNGFFANLSGVTMIGFAIIMVGWYVCYLRDDRNQVYLLAVAMILGWMLTIVFTKGFRNVHAFSTMLSYIIIQDVTRFITIYIFILVGFSLAMHTLFQISAVTVAAYASPWDTVFLAFNLMLGMADIFDDQFEQGYIDAGSSSVWVKIVYLFYMVLATIIMLNLLIAMLSDTYNEIKRNEGTTWRVNSLRMALRIERWLPILKKLATRISLMNISTDYDKTAERWYMKIPMDSVAPAKSQSVSEMSKHLRKLEVEMANIQASNRVLHDKMDTILDHLQPGKQRIRPKTATRRT